MKPPDAHSRRAFLGRSSAALSALALSGCAPEGSPADDATGEGQRLDPAILSAVAEVVLPGELGVEGRTRAVQAFQEWAAAYRPVAELNHGYGTSEISYGPPDPVPGWGAQLQALDIEARKRHGAGLPSLEAGDRQALLARHLEGQGGSLPDPLRAGHVALALLAHWAESPDAVDLCYERRISPRTCRGLDRTSELPEAST